VRMPVVAPIAAVLVACAACTGGAVSPATLDTKTDTCGTCRMTVSDRRLAAQVVASGDEPRFFDDLNCLAQYVREHSLRRDAAIFVADHRTGEWTAATTAVYTRLPHAATPMASGLVAHASPESRAADAGTIGGDPVGIDVVLGEHAEARSR
jgi:copper chaperone NosL